LPKRYAYSRVRHGDLNILGPFIPFASPVDQSWCDAMKEATKPVLVGLRFSGLKMNPARPTIKKRTTISRAFVNVLRVFDDENVGLVVRLNDEL
jgi:cell division cycle 14